MPTLFSLRTAINTYPKGINNLKGCLGDAEDIGAYLERTADLLKIKHKDKHLFDEAATRQNFIDTFLSHFGQAKKGDICVWYHSGHGSRCPAPPEFAWASGDKSHRTIVCHDSRGPGGKGDLLDKEMSWLLWKVTHDKDITFLVLTDCCYAGGNLRDGQEHPDHLRLHHTDDGTKPATSYLGADDYDQSNGKWSPPRGNYVQLAASRPDQSALERFFLGTGYRGIFTRTLLQELNAGSRPFSYQELHQRLNARVLAVTPDQSPQLDHAGTASNLDLFLDGNTSRPGSLHWLYYHQDSRCWRINAGGIDGLDDDSVDQITYEADGQSYPLALHKVYPGYATVKPAASDLTTQDLYPVRIHWQKEKSLRVSLHPDLPDTIKDDFRAAFAEVQPARVLLTEAFPTHQFQPGPNGTVDFKHLDRERPLLMKRQPQNNLDYQKYWREVRDIAKWEHLLSLDNPSTSLGSKDIEIQLSRAPLGQPNQEANLLPVELTAAGLELINQVSLDPLTNRNRTRKQNFAVEVRNTSQRPFFVNALYLSNEFGIETRLQISKTTIPPGGTARLRYQSNGQEYHLLTSSITDDLRSFGVVRNTEYLKFVVSTEHLDFGHLQQHGINPLNHAMMGVAIDEEEDLPYSDWATFLVPIHTSRLEPFTFLDSQLFRALPNGQSITSPNKDLKAAFYPLTGLAYLFPGVERPELPTGFTPHYWTDGYNHARGVAVIAILQPLIPAQDSLQIITPATVNSLTLFGYDPVDNSWQKLPLHQVENTFVAPSLPKPVSLDGGQTKQAALLVCCHQLPE